MAPRNSPFSVPIVPSAEHSALAIVILQSKPSNVSVRDHVAQLRKHLRTGQPAFSPKEHSHYLDLVGYWQNQCQTAQEECGRLRSVNLRLERSNQQLAQRTSADQDERPSTATTCSKRDAPASTSKAIKRPRLSVCNVAEQSVAATQQGIDHDYDFLESLGDDGTYLTEALYTTHKLCRATTPDSETLCHSLIRTTSSLAKIISFVAHNHETLSRQGRRSPGAQSLSEDKSGFAQALTVCARSFMSVLVGMSKMIKVGGDDRLPSLVICELANMFKTSLLAIEASARETAELSLNTQVQTRHGKGKALVKPKESIPARSLAHFLTGLLGLLEKTNLVHQQIFDAFMFLLLERVSKRLYYCTFGEHRSAIDVALEPVNDRADLLDTHKQEQANLGIHLEVKALVLILHRAMGLAPHHMNQTSARAKSKSPARLGRTLSMKSLTSAPKNRLSSIAKDRLQRTLVTCMYGSTVDDEFLDILTKPMPAMRIGMLPNVAKVEDNDVEQWYKEEIWRLVGWDILARENGW